MYQRAVQWVSVGGFWDHPLDGWVRVERETARLYFQLLWDEEGEYLDQHGAVLGAEEPLVYRLWYVGQPHRNNAMRKARDFRHSVGWHFDYAPGQCRGEFDKSAHPDWEQFYKRWPPEQRENYAELKGSLPCGHTDLRTAWLDDEVSVQLVF